MTGQREIPARANYAKIQVCDSLMGIPAGRPNSASHNENSDIRSVSNPHAAHRTPWNSTASQELPRSTPSRLDASSASNILL